MPLTTKIYEKVFRFGTRSDEITADFRGVQLTVPAGDITIVPGLVGGFYEKIELDIFERLAAISRYFIDVGANIGLYSCIAADRAPADGKIVAFEPVPGNLHYLRRNLAINGRTAQVLVEEQAVGEACGTIRIHLAEGSIGTHSPSAKNALGSTTSIAARVVSLDDYAQRALTDCAIDLLKVDVEGYEGAVLRGARKILHEDKPTLFVEFVPGHLLNCEFSPGEFLDMIFDVYDTVFLVNEPRGSIKLCSRDNLLGYSAHDHKNVNLIATSKSIRRDHCQEIESVRAAISQRGPGSKSK